MFESDFPLEFPFTRILAEHLEEGVADAPFLVAAMTTASYADKASKLVDSCRKFRLSHVVYEVPTVHQSISPKGGADLRFTKANFIHFLLEKFNRPILYLDADTYFEQYPEAIGDILRSKCEFAIYNWLADEHTEAYLSLPINIGTPAKPIATKNRFYTFSHSIDRYSTEQLLCSGAVQLYKNTGNAKKLLGIWHHVVALNEKAQDDRCLDFAFNNYPPGLQKPLACWLGKAYARYAWWIYVQPVINHPDIPDAGTDFLPLKEYGDKKRWYPERTKMLNVQYIFPKGCVVDTEQKFLCHVDGNQLVAFAKIGVDLWL